MQDVKVFVSMMMMLLLASIPGVSQIDHTDFLVTFKMQSNDTGGGGTTTTPPDRDRRRDGGGAAGDRIKTTWPSSGVMAMHSTMLSWDEVGERPYRVTIKDGNNEVFSVQVNSNKIMIDLSAIGVEEGKTYQALVESNDERISKTLNLSFLPNEELEKHIAELESDQAYQSSTGIKKALMKAFYLESKGWKYEAYKAFDIQTSQLNEMITIVNMYNQFATTY